MIKNVMNFNFGIQRLPKLLCMLFFLIISTSLLAQKKQITGKVQDEQGVPLIGASVMEKNTTNGTSTDVDGNFSISVSETSILEVSYIGFNSKDIVVKNTNVFLITLVENTHVLEGVVVVGYGTSVKKDLTTAVTSVRNKDFIQGASNSPIQLIDGKVAGVSVSNPAAADPNRGTDVQVRGASSLKAGNSPLIVIDGMPGGDLRNLAQQDIESITILKDGSAAAIYGSRAANGVILIQTKQGQAGKVRISYDGYLEHDFVAKKPNVLSAEEFLEKGRATDRGSKTDWYDELVNSGNFGQNHNISLSGGSETSIFRVSANYRTKEGIDIASDREEYGLRGSFKQITLENLLEVTGNFSYRIAEEKYTDYAVFKQAVKLNPTVDVEEMDYFKGRYDEYNPVKFLKDRKNGATQEYATIDLNIKLNLTKDLNTEVKLARQGHDKKEREYYTKNHKESIENDRAGRARIRNEKWVDWTFEWLGNYQFKINKHDVKVMGGYSYQEFNNEWFWAENMNFPSDAFEENYLQGGDWNRQVGRLGMESSKSKEKTIAFLGRVNYNYDDLLLVTASLRHEGNSKFGKDHKWGNFPAISAAWRFSRLSFFEESDVVDDLKLRFSYGETGRSGFDRYTALATWTGYGYMINSGGVWQQVYGPQKNPNANLGWEKQISYNLGFDYTLFKSRLNGSLDFFIRDGKDIISDYDVSMPPYLHQQMVVNVGTTTSKGVELQLNWDAVQTENFTYSTNLTASYIKTKLKSFSKGDFKLGYIEGDGLPSPGNPGPAQRVEDGKELGSFYGYRYAGVDSEGRIQIYKGGVKDSEVILANDAQDSDRTYIGNGTPKYELAWGNTFTYKNFDLSLFFRGKFDYQILNQYQMYFGLQAEPEVNLLSSAYKENGHILGNKVVCDYFLEKGDYFKLDNITIGWTPKIKSKWIANLRVYGTMKNVFTLTKYTGLDPTVVETTGLWSGMGKLDVYPITRNISFGVQISY